MVIRGKLVILRLVTFLTCLLRSWTLEVCNHCDCTVSEVSADIRGVRSVRLPCDEGRLDWISPYGALRVELRFNEVSDFRACFVINSRNVRVKVSQESWIGSKFQFSRPSASFKTLIIAAGRTSEYCVDSATPVLLFLEAETVTRSVGLASVTFQYLLEKKSQKQEIGHIDECRPCDRGEIIRAYCSSDFVVVGRIGDVTTHRETDKMEVGVHTSRVIRQRDTLFYKPNNKSTIHYGKLLINKNCYSRTRSGVFLFTGKIRFGEMVATCVPSLYEWQKISTDAGADGTMECALD